MQIHSITAKLEDCKGVLIVFSYADAESEEYVRADHVCSGRLAELKFSGKALQSECLRLDGTRSVLLVGLGQRSDVTVERLRRAAGVAIKAARERAPVATIVVPKIAPMDAATIASALTEGALLGAYRFLRYKTMRDEIKHLESLTLLVEDRALAPQAQRAIENARVLADAVCYVRDLVNTPPTDMNPETLEQETRMLAKRYGFSRTVLDRAQLAKRGMGGILAVGKGSAIPPRMLILEYAPKGAKRHLVFCGKGVCFDSGGYNLKTRALELMKDDMGGAAALLGMLRVLAERRVAVRVTIILGVVENLISGNAYKPGDVVRAMNGKTIEIENTDAEGRVVLADCLSYASTIKGADAIIDIATLTGASMVALGPHAAAVLSPNAELIRKLRSAGDASGDRCWEIPFWEEYREDIKSDIADVKNMGVPSSAGITAGAMLLREFVATPERWAHIDMGGAVADDHERAYLPKGASGWGVRILTRFVEEY